MQRALRCRLCRLCDFFRRRHHRLDRRDFVLHHTLGALLGVRGLLGDKLCFLLCALGLCQFLGRLGLPCLNRLQILLFLLLRIVELALRTIGLFACRCSLTRDQLGLTARLFLAFRQLGLVDDRCDHRRDFGGGLDRHVRCRSVAFDEHPLLAYFDLDRACLARGIGLLDLGGLLARQRDLFLLAAATVRLA